MIVWGNKWCYKPVSNGLIVPMQCPECKNHVDFFEVIPKNYFTLYWLPLYSTESKPPLLECPVCNSRFNIPEEIEKNRGLYSNIIELNKEVKTTQIDEVKVTLECSYCSQKFRIPKLSDEIIATCPKCKHCHKIINGNIINI